GAVPTGAQIADDERAQWINITRWLPPTLRPKELRIRCVPPTPVFPKHVTKRVKFCFFAVFRKQQAEPGCIFRQTPAVFPGQLQQPLRKREAVDSLLPANQEGQFPRVRKPTVPLAEFPKLLDHAYRMPCICFVMMSCLITPRSVYFR